MKANPLAPQFASRHIVQLVFPPPPPLTDVLLNTAPAAERSSEAGMTTSHDAAFQSWEVKTNGHQSGSALESRRWEGPHMGRVREILGEDARGLQFSLVAELKTGMRWEFMLCTMSCDRRGVPLKVIIMYFSGPLSIPQRTSQPVRTLPLRLFLPIVGGR